jgi:hypothetical protein
MSDETQSNSFRGGFDAAIKMLRESKECRRASVDYWLTLHRTELIPIGEINGIALAAADYLEANRPKE